MGELIKHAVDVSLLYEDETYRVTMLLYSLMDRQAQERLLLWKVTDTRLMTKGYRSLSLSKGIMRAWFPAPFITFLISSDSSLTFRLRSSQSTAHICRFTKRRSMTC